MDPVRTSSHWAVQTISAACSSGLFIGKHGYGKHLIWAKAITKD